MSMTMINKKNTFRKKASLFLAMLMLFQAVWPSVSLALTSGPSAPEFSSFEPVATTNMVNEFSGDLTYNVPVLNIPGPDGAGYAMSLSYHSGESLESEASWVGYGWTLNPGAINRNKRGFADDTKSEHTFHNDVPKNWTASVGTSVGDIELFSTDIPISLSAGLRYNNYKGFGYTAGIGLSVKGIVSLGYSVSDGSGSFSAQVNPAGLLSLKKKKKAEDDKTKEKYDEAKTPEEKSNVMKEKVAKLKADQKQARKDNMASKAAGALGGLASSYGMHSFGDMQMPTSMTPYTGRSFNVSLNVNFNAGPVPIGPTFGLNGNYTQQKNEAIKVRRGYGYLYSNTAYSDDQGMMDYYTEKDSPFNKRDRYMGIPFSNADQYSVTGEGLSGAFRLYNKNVGSFRPNASVSKTQIYQVSPEFNIGLTMGAGTDFGVGLQTLNVFGGQWGNGNTASAFSDYKFTEASDESFFFRFSNDLGGDVNYGSDDLVTALVSNKDASLVDASSAGLNHQENNLTSSIDNGGAAISRSGRSSYIAYNTNGDLNQTSLTNKKVYAYDNSAKTNSLRQTTTRDEQIAEIANVNEDGNTYVYGIPSISKNEKNLSFSMENGAVNNYFQAYKNISGGNKMKVGSECADGYATAYLLTQITTPDYIDRTLDGPTSDDFGGYTSFEYNRLYSDYHWRMPYNGLSYSGGDLSNPGDDMGSFNSGDKEVYYLNKIVTKTHIAVFRTSLRNDGKEAANDYTAANSSVAVGAKQLMKLDSICLYTNEGGNLGKLLKKTCFKYSYSLCQGVPNGTAGTGKLTLDAVWFEYEGIAQAKVSPYKFFYDYANPSSYPFPYYDATNPNRFTEYNTIIGTTGSQNPNYNVCDIDAWGNYQAGGASRFLNLQRHLNQNPAATFDPAAWQLKRIALPSGGEIHIQYEQDDYQYVQNRRAMGLVSLTSTSTDGSATSFELNTATDLGYTLAEKQALVNLINSELANDKIYFKFLYSLMGSNVVLGNCNSEYVSGYVNFNSASLNTSQNVVISVGGTGGHSLPIDICKDLVKKEKGGKINQSGNCDPATGIDDEGAPGDIVMQLLNKFGTMFTPGNLCVSIAPTVSYLKIPLLKPKKGGGLRVKRLLMYDPDGVDDGMAALYGTEYIYKTDNGESSGVATNEPSAIREENPLINFLPKRTDQTFLQKAISGIDREQFEGPIGESILPSPSVGYSRIVAKSIHNGKTNTGFIVSDFYTAKDFPFDMQYNNTAGNFSGKGVSNTDINDQTFDKFWLNIPAVFVNVSINNIWASQGYRFIQNSMHGQPKSVSTYAGNYVPGTLSLANKSSSTEYEYFKPGEKISVLKDDGSTELKELGKEMEVVMESRAVEDVTEDISTEFDASMGIVPPVVYVPYFTGSGSLSYAERKMYTHVTSKVISFPTVQKSITSTQDGISHKTENLVFSRFTGKPVQTVTTDGYNGKNLEQSTAHVGKYTSYTVPGYTQYKELGQKAINQRKLMSSPTLNMNILGSGAGPYVINFSIGTGTSADLCSSLGALTIGDLLAVKMSSTTDNTRYYFHVDGINGSSVSAVPSGNLNISFGNVTSGVSSGAIQSIEIIKSGRTNQLNTNVGNYTVYGTSTAGSSSSSNLAARLAFVSSLNTALTNCINGTGSGGSADVINLNSSNIDFASSSNTECMHSSGQNYQITVSLNSSLGTNRFEIRIYQTTAAALTVACNTTDVYLKYPGTFSLDNSSGKIKYAQSAMPCALYDVSCLQFCSPGGVSNTVSNVLAASASTMNHLWPYNATIFDLTGTNSGKNEYETGSKGKWRTLSSYTYKESIQGGAVENGTIHERNYKAAGTFPMVVFNWKNLLLNDTGKWVRVSTISKYSPSGNAIEEKDAIHLYSAAKYGYNQTVPYLVGQNADYNSVFFESFENSYVSSSNTYLEEKVLVAPASITSSYAHSGKKSFQLTSQIYTATETTLSSQMQNQGVSCKVWVKDPQRSAMPLSGSIVGNISVPLAFAKVAQTGEWTLYEARLTNWQTMTLNGTIQVRLINAINAQPVIYLDDYRLQPLNSQVNAYVYDPKTLKLLTSFDDQHFGLYYQYNQEGKLVRKIIETERGMKTISETQYNTPKTNRP